MLWINVPYPINLAMKVSVTDIAKLPTISNIEVAAVICALITMVLMFLSVVDLDDTAGAIFLEDGSSLLKMINKQFLPVLLRYLATNQINKNISTV